MMAEELSWSGPDPWIPKGFARLPRTERFLIVGESHYGAPHERFDREFTIGVIAERVQGHHGHFFSPVERIVGGQRPHAANAGQFWNRTAFLNYAPHLVPSGTPCLEGHYDGAAARLMSVVAKEQPLLVCFFSKAAWDRRPWGSPPSYEIFSACPEPLDDDNDDATVYRGLGDPVLMVRFNHPRRIGAPVQVWRAWFEAMRIRAAALA